MNKHKWLLLLLVIGFVAFVAIWKTVFMIPKPSPLPRTGNDRVMIVCCDDDGDFSPALYFHGAPSGGSDFLKDIKEVAKFLRADDAPVSIANMVGYYFHQGGAIKDGSCDIGLALYNAPKPGADGKVIWHEFCSWNVDLVLVNVSTGVAECYSGPAAGDKGPKTIIAKVENLPIPGLKKK